MLIKSYELKNFKIKDINYYLFYGSNTGLIEETINKVFKPQFPKNITNYDENDLLNNIHNFKEIVFNKSFFDDEKFIIINRASNKILEVIQQIIEANLQDLKIIIKAGILDKKSKLRSYFEKNKSTVSAAFYEDNQQSLALIVQNFFKEKKINTSNEIINLIVERSKGNRININNELEKILLYTKNSNRIGLGDVLKLTNLTENHNISELVDNCLAKNKKKIISILNENNFSNEDCIIIVRSFILKAKKLLILSETFKTNKNVDLTISSAKPPIFWKEKEITKQQIQKWSPKNIKRLIYVLSETELQIKKNINNSINLLTDFILFQSSSTTNN